MGRRGRKGKKRVEVPLFSSYIFVNVNKKEYFEAINTNGAVRYVSFLGKAVPIPPKQILAIKQYLDEGEIIQENLLKKINLGDMVEVTKGPLVGLKGNVANYKGKNRLVVEIEAIKNVIMVTIPKSYLMVVNEP